MGPKTLTSCYICGRDFGQSITLHEQKCLSKWRAENGALPPENQCPTPIKMDEGDLLSDSMWQCLRCQNVFPLSKRGEHVAICSLPKIDRPKTRTLNRVNPPNGLSIADPSRQASCRLLRPQTKTLERPTPNLGHPTIIESRKLSDKININGINQNNITNNNKPVGNANNKIEVPQLKENKTKIPVSSGNLNCDKIKESSPKNNAQDKPKQGMGFPPPCKSCQRGDAPERFHSHHRGNCPANKKLAIVGKSESDSEVVTTTKKARHSNTLPVPINSKKDEKLSPVRPPGPHQQKQNHSSIPVPSSLTISSVVPPTQVVVAAKKDPVDESQREQSSKRPRIVVCYLCGREFGTRSYPFHEPHCIERWRRDNQSLPADLRRPLPKRPTSGEGFSETAWETFQAQLIPCPSCGRTFFPNRLPIHQKACKGAGGSPPGHNGGSNTSLPRFKGHDQQDANEPKRAILKPAMVACYICARQFGSMSLQLHEPQCLKKWKQENDRLPGHMQRTEPEKPTAVFKDDGTLDTDAMEDAAWKSHVVQLPRCSKCARTFFPDRLAIHEPNCKANHLESNNKLQKPIAVS